MTYLTRSLNVVVRSGSGILTRCPSNGNEFLFPI